MAAGAGSCLPIWGWAGGGCTLLFFLGGWPCSGGREKRMPSARCDRNISNTCLAARITDIRAPVWSPASVRHTASKHET